MKNLIITVLALALLGGTAAMAQHDDWNGHGQMSAPQSNNDNQRHWSRGDRLSSQYRGDQYVVSDWRGNHLRKPGRGQHWVRRNNQFILVAITSGLIADAVFSNR